MKKLECLRNIAAMLLLVGVMCALQSCQGKVISEASDAIEKREYKKALEKILTLSDDAIIESDTLSQLLATAYYGLELKPKMGIASDCYAMDFTPDGKTVIFTDHDDNSLQFYSYPEMVFQRSMTLPAKPFNIDISPDGKKLAAALADETVLVFDLQSGNRLKTITGHNSCVRDVAFRDNGYLFSAGNDQNLAAWDIVNDRIDWKEHIHSKNIKSLKLSKDGSRIVTASNDGSSSIVATSGSNAGKEVQRFMHGDNYVNDAAISPDNKLVATVSGDSIANIWDAATGTRNHSINLHESLCSADFSADGRNVIIGGSRQTYILNAEKGTVEATILCFNMPVWSAKFLPDGEFAFADNSRFWHAKLLKREELVAAARKLLAE